MKQLKDDDAIVAFADPDIICPPNTPIWMAMQLAFIVSVLFKKQIT